MERTGTQYETGSENSAPQMNRFLPRKLSMANPAASARQQAQQLIQGSDEKKNYRGIAFNNSDGTQRRVDQGSTLASLGGPEAAPIAILGVNRMIQNVLRLILPHRTIKSAFEQLRKLFQVKLVALERGRPV